MTTTALITGANKGIGFETARQLGEHGATVLVGARDAELGRAAERALTDDHGVHARCVRLEVTDQTSVRRAAEWIHQEYGHLDILVNNAGIARADGDRLASESTPETMREVFETNVFGVVAVTNAMLPLLRAAPAARIVNVSSEVGSIGSLTDPKNPLSRLPSSLPYPSSKTTLNMITAQYAKELRDTPIKVNAANPGYCATDLNGHSGVRTAEQGAGVSVHLAMLGDDGPSGRLWGHLAASEDPAAEGALPW